MREIKFRFWKDNTKEMLSLKEALEYLLNVSDLISGKYDNFKPLQYTGLKDKNGVEIYEGDIVECFYPKRNDITHTLLGNVAFIDGCWFITESKRNYFSALYSEFESMEVIGNIYEHPHLLENNQ